MARELHDTLLQGFTGIVLQLEGLRHRLGPSRNGDADELSRILSVPVTYFFEGVESEGEAGGTSGPEAGATAAASIHSSDPDFTNQRETLQLISSYYRIPDSKVRAEVLSLLKTLGRPGDN